MLNYERDFECCEFCGISSPEVEYVLNPFYLEIYNEEHWECLCPECYYEFSMDI